ncbi:DNA-binding transcriptional regulator, LysR family [Kosakonia oryzendophytica]|uniref:DNA-binding transcriptional regulator, LysR family n=1 Tax=Kosakonia oryzendophytica TaxID=1005665 RepID=A0A1C3YRK4_9ENTR|nr:LysR family transcriptional regulator [Kosakonia oryzendophytica]AMO48299.1 putative transcriptional regulator [Enterobacter sp. FY-07]TDT59035.1 DNA-binding transcriptional LysR family regulator [Enterobacter sp. AG5470]WBT59943.1 LysR family transcriptional regulator [Kosakonia oryzendophytica]SCB72652.1 DNA-binding transcriptional regulator, LysR family [Kosakonia oryzendophytica]
MLTLRQIRYFVATAEMGQISLAAVHLNISQSAVTGAIQELEQLLGKKLFTRSVHGMMLTDYGNHFLNHAYTVLQTVENAVRSMPVSDTGVRGTLRLAASYTVIGYFLPFHLQRLMQDYPHIDIQLFEYERQDIEQGLIDQTLDMALVLTGNLRHQSIYAETLFNSTRRLWLPSRHPLCEKSQVTLADVADEPFIMLTVDEAADSAMRYWEEAGASPGVILRTSSVEAVRSMVANGSGVTILSDLVYRPWSLEGRRIETRSLVNNVHPMSVGLAWRYDARFTPAMAALREYFRSAFVTQQITMVRR